MTRALNILGVDIYKSIKNIRPNLPPIILVTDYKEKMSQTIKVALQLDTVICFYNPLETEKLLHALNTIRYQQLKKILKV